MRCNICNTDMSFIFNKNILNKYNVRYFYCPKCGYLTTEEPFWLKEAYSNAIAITDIGLISRNIEMSKLLACTLHFIVKNKDRCIDISGGYGILCRIMRDYGFHYYWDDPYCQNLFAKGFEAASHPGYFPVASFFESVFGNFSFYSYKKACGQKKTVRGSKNSRRLSNGTPAI